MISKMVLTPNHPRGSVIATAHFPPHVSILDDGGNAFGSTEVGSITPQDISRFLVRTVRERKWKPATANRYKAFLSLCFRLGIENGKCSQNPARFVRRFRENNERVRFLSEEEEIRLREAIQSECPEHMPDLDIVLNTGMRKGEQYGLNWGMSIYRGVV